MISPMKTKDSEGRKKAAIWLPEKIIRSVVSAW